jgi:flagellar L-ring protein precursor FlgH
MKFVINLICIVISPIVWSVTLFDEAVYRPLIADHRAFLLGDVLTVLVMETSNAQTSADLASGKKIKTALEGSYNKDKVEIGFGLKGDGRTTAKTGRNGKIKAALTVQIKGFMPNGNYHVEGQQFIVINGEQQNILLSGIVRQEDISAQNTVLSTRLANAKITYNGNGSVSNSQRYNYFYKVLSFMGLV